MGAFDWLLEAVKESMVFRRNIVKRLILAIAKACNIPINLQN